MKVGVPKEIKVLEYRVGMIPSGVKELVNEGHEVFVETDAGMGIGMTDQDYIDAGASILYGVVPGTQELVTINTSTGVATSPFGPGSLGTAISGLAYNDTTDQLFGSNAATGDLYEINVGTGAAALIGSFTGATVGVRGLAINPGNQVLYGIDATNNTIVTIDTGSGAASIVGDALTDDIDALTWR